MPPQRAPSFLITTSTGTCVGVTWLYVVWSGGLQRWPDCDDSCLTQLAYRHLALHVFHSVKISEMNRMEQK